MLHKQLLCHWRFEIFSLVVRTRDPCLGIISTVLKLIISRTRLLYFRQFRCFFKAFETEFGSFRYFNGL
ncbi:hypothetical protein X975_18765, partial [Stegodyphus mimosarum]